ncbi:MAG: N-acetyltransferase [Nannocystaceae bacterium]
MILRPIHEGDRSALVAILEEAFRPDEVAVALELIDLALAGSPDYQVLVAALPDLDLDVAGYLCHGPTPMTAATHDLYWIVTHPQARGRGLARALIDAMESELRALGGRRNVRIETSEQESYGAARHLYARCGYEQATLLPDFYGPGDGLLIFYRQL